MNKMLNKTAVYITARQNHNCIYCVLKRLKGAVKYHENQVKYIRSMQDFAELTSRIRETEYTV